MNLPAKQEGDFVGQYVPEWLKVLCVILHALTSVNGVFGSVLILISLSRNKFFRAATCTYSAYLANLAIVDLYFEAYHFPLIAVGLAMGEYPAANKLHCTINAFLTLAAYSAYLLTLTAISFDRYMRVCHILLYRKYFSRRTSEVVCLLIWFLGCLTPLPGIVNDALGYDRSLHACGVEEDAHVGNHLTYFLVFVLSVLASGYFSVRIFVVYWQAKHRVTESRRQSMVSERNADTSAYSKSVKPSDMALLRTLLVIYLCLLLLIAPLLIVTLVKKPYHISSSVRVLLLWLLSVNNSVDWIVYGLMHTCFREDFRQILTTCNFGLRVGAAPKQPASGLPLQAGDEEAYFSATAIRVFAEDGRA